MKILIVEDEPKVASFIKKGLEENSYEAEIAYDGISGEKLARMYKYDLFILDIIIPGISGLDLCRKILLPTLHMNSGHPMFTCNADGSDIKKITFNPGKKALVSIPVHINKVVKKKISIR